jgi:hypothetical protein
MLSPAKRAKDRLQAHEGMIDHGFHRSGAHCTRRHRQEMHGFALRLMAATVGWVLANDEIIAALAEQCTGR